MEEVIFLKEDSILVTNTRFVVSGHTYAMNGVTSVKNVSEQPSRTLPVLIGLIGILLIKDSLIFAVLLMGVAVGMFYIYRRKYVVALTTSSGEVKAFKSIDAAFIERIVSALNKSIIHRG